jgi:hypothetical protein
VAVIGLIVLAVAVYGVLRAIWHVLVAIVEITAISAGSITAAAVLVIIAVRVIRWQHSRRTPVAGLTLLTFDTATEPVSPQALGPGNTGPDATELFAEAVANGMDPRFVERILGSAMERRDQ